MREARGVNDSGVGRRGPAAGSGGERTVTPVLNASQQQHHIIDLDGWRYPGRSEANMSDIHRDENRQFVRDNSAEWKDCIQRAFGRAPAKSAYWDDLEDALEVLAQFMGRSLNHTMLPDGGGLDMCHVASYHEPGMMDFQSSERQSYVLRFKSMHFEYVRDHPAESFFLVEADHLSPSGVYEEIARQSEELLEISPGEYQPRAIWDRGFLGYDRSDREIPIPNEARLVSQYLSGKFLIVAKASRWNRTNSTYDGRHNRMTAQEIRAAIERSH